MFSLIKLLSVLALICIVPISNARRKGKVKHGPSGMNVNESTTCKEFAKYARFNPYSVLDQEWFVFYYWGPPKTIETLVFTFPSANHSKHLHKMFDGNTILPINWKARHILMENHKKEITLLVERGDRGQYWGFILQKARKGQKIRPRDLRLKQIGDNQIIGLMDCDRDSVLAMCKIQEVPPKNRLQDEAARLGYRGRRGKSYLYEGHEWMPIPEADEKHFWAPKPKEKTSQESSKEIESTSKEKLDSEESEESLNFPKDQLKENADAPNQEPVDNKENNNQNRSSHTSNNQTSNNQTSNDQTFNNQTSNDQTSNNQTSYDQTGNNQTSNDQTFNNQTSNDQTSNNQTSNDQTSNNQTSNNQTNNAQTSNDQTNNNLTRNLQVTDNEMDNNQTINNLATEEINNKTIIEESEESNEVPIDDSTDEPDYSLTMDEKIVLNKKLNPRTITEPEVDTEDSELELLTTPEPYTSQSSKKISDEGEDDCKQCFTLKPRQREVKKASPEIPDQTLKDPTNTLSMETKPSSGSFEINYGKVDDDSKKDSSVDNNEV